MCDREASRAAEGSKNRRFPSSNRGIDRSLSAMNGCKGKGGENPELQVTDHGSDTACMQTVRGGKIIHAVFQISIKEKKECLRTFLKKRRRRKKEKKKPSSKSRRL